MTKIPREQHRTVLIGFASGLVFFAIAAAVRLYLLHGPGFESFDSVDLIVRTPALETTPDVTAALTRARAAGICGLWWHVRHFRMGSTSDLEIQGCDGLRAVVPRDLVQPYDTLDRVAIEDRSGTFHIATAGERGHSRLDEYQATLPKLVDVGIAAWPKMRDVTETKMLKTEAADRARNAQQEAVRKSFAPK